MAPLGIIDFCHSMLLAVLIASILTIHHHEHSSECIFLLCQVQLGTLANHTKLDLLIQTSEIVVMRREGSCAGSFVLQYFYTFYILNCPMSIFLS